MGETQRHVGVLFGQQEGHAFVFIYRFHNAKDLLDQLRCQTHRRLIQKDRFRPRHQRAANRRHLLFAARCVSRLAFAPLAQTGKIGVDHLKVGSDRAFAVRPGIGAGHQVFFDGQVLETVTPLHDLNNACLDQIGGIFLGNVGAIVLN